MIVILNHQLDKIYTHLKDTNGLQRALNSKCWENAEHCNWPNAAPLREALSPLASRVLEGIVTFLIQLMTDHYSALQQLDAALSLLPQAFFKRCFHRLARSSSEMRSQTG